MAKCYFPYGILSENPGNDEGKFLKKIAYANF
jgi:hypothetical protein